MAYIGVKLANGEFYPIFEEDTPAKKKLVVTTVKDNQPNVQIDLYRGEPGMPAEDTRYIGSLLVNDIARAPRGMPDIELEVMLNEDKTLEAYAQDKVSGGQSKFSIALTELSLGEVHDIPEFDIHETETLIDESMNEVDSSSLSLDEDLIIEEPVAVKQEEIDELESDVAEPEASSEDFSFPDEFSAGSLPELEDTTINVDELSFDAGTDTDMSSEVTEDTTALPSLESDNFDISSGDAASDFSLGGTSLEIPEMDEQTNSDSVFNEDTSSILDTDEDAGLSGADTMKFDVELPDVPLDDEGEISTEATTESTLEFPPFNEAGTETLEATDFDITGEAGMQGAAEDFSSKELSMDSGETIGLEEETVFSSEASDTKIKKTKPPKKEREQYDERRPCAPLWCKVLVPLAIILVAVVVLLLVGRCSADKQDKAKPAVTQPATTGTPTQPNTSTQGSSQTQPTTTGQTGTTQTAPAATQPASPAQTGTQTKPAAATGTGSTTTQKAPASTKPPKPAPGSKTPGVWYKIRWGDTLWDLSIAFYRTPWKYMKIYNENRKIIKHPDKIISGTWIYVPK